MEVFQMNELLTINELAARLKVNLSWLYSKTRIKGKDSIPVYRLGKYLRFREDEVMDWIQRQQKIGNNN